MLYIKRENFKKIIKMMSDWEIDRRRGNYRFPNGGYLFQYLENFITDFLKNNSLALDKSGDVRCTMELGGKLMIFRAFGEDEKIESQDERIKILIREMIY